MHPHVQMRTATIVKEDGVTMVLLHGSPCRRREDRVGMPSESGSYHFRNDVTQSAFIFVGKRCTRYTLCGRERSRRSRASELLRC